MKISIAQTRPIKGNIEANLSNHLKFIEAALTEKARLIVFPELSLTGYEPELAAELATTKDDERLDVLQEISTANDISICVGLPTKSGTDILISLIVFEPGGNRTTYSKQYLYPSETGVFSAGNNPLVLDFGDGNIVAPAICYELSNRAHHEFAKSNGANIYIASVLNSVSGVDADIEKLSAIARDYEMTVFMSNYVGVSGGYECAGRSSVWNKKGDLMAQLDGISEGQIIHDTENGKVVSLLHS